MRTQMLRISAVAGLSFALATGQAAAEGDVDFRLTLLHANDGESQLVNAGPGREDFGGAARFATLLSGLRNNGLLQQAPLHGENPDQGVVVVSSGDNYLAGPEFSASLEKGVPYYDTIGFSRMRFDAFAMGNHEFDFGPDVLADFIDGFFRTESQELRNQARFVSANLNFAAEPRLQALVDRGIVRKHLIVQRGNQQIGIVGATTPRLPFISSPRFVQVDPDVVGAVQTEVNALLDQGVNKIVFISHLQSIQEDLAVIAELRGVDIAVAGGGSELLANDDDLLIPGDESEVYGPYPLLASDADSRQVPVVTTSGDYHYVGRLVIDFDAEGEVLQIQDASGPVRVAGGANPDAVEPDPFVQARVIAPVEAYVTTLGANVIGSSDVALDGRRTQVRTVETNEGNLVADAMLWQATELADDFGLSTPEIALQNGGGIRNNAIIPAGNLTELTTFEILPFANFVCLIPSVPAAQVKEILENCVSRVEAVDGRFAQIAGFSFSWDPTGTPQIVDANGNVTTPGSRVRNVQLADGTPLVVDGIVPDAAPAIDIASIDFLARGGDQYPYRGAAFTTLGVTYQRMLRDYIELELGGTVTAVDYPEGGEGRITRLSAPLRETPAPGQTGQGSRVLSVDRMGSADPSIQFELGSAGPVRITVHNLEGRRVATLIDEVLTAGSHSTRWTTNQDTPSGIYFVRYERAGRVDTRKVVRIR